MSTATMHYTTYLIVGQQSGRSARVEVLESAPLPPASRKVLAEVHGFEEPVTVTRQSWPEAEEA